jgi:pyruvate dehydrogenase E1 component alpha subunit
MSTPTSAAVAGVNVADRAHGYGMPGVIVDGQDVDAVEEAVREAVDRARAGKGPTLIETKTYRYCDHAVNMGRDLTPRGPEHEDWVVRDPIVLYRQRLIADGIGEGELDAIDAAIADEVADSLKFARESAYPTFEEAFDHVFVDRVPIPADIAAHA